MVLFREALKKLHSVQSNLSMSFDHNSQIIIGKKNTDKLEQAKKHLYKAILKLHEIE